MRHLPSLALAVILLGSASAQAAEPKPKADEPPPEEGIVHPDAPDLLGGHWIITLDGSVWVPSSGMLPDIAALGDIEVGGGLHGHLGVGLNRYLVLNIVDGGFGRVPSRNIDCGGCGVWSISVGPSLVLRPTQGFAFDPWISYGLGYRHNVLNLSGGSSDKVLGMDVAKLALGGDWYPNPVFGFGPYLETDIGVRTSGKVTGFAVFHAGLRITFDPVRAGVTTTAQTARR